MTINRITRNIFFTLSCIVGAQSAYAMVIDPDSLERILNSSPEYKNKLKTIHALSQHHLYSNPERSKELLMAGLAVAREQGDSVAVGNIYIKLSQIGSIQGEFENALLYDKKFLVLSELAENTYNISQALNNIGDDYMYMGFYSDAYDHYQRARKLAMQMDDDLLTAITSYNVGRVLKAMGQIEQARYYINASLKLSREIDDWEGIAYSLKDLGEMYIIEEKFEESLGTLTESLKVSDSLNLQYLTPEIYQKIAEAHYFMSSLDTAMEYYQRALDIYERVDNQQGIGLSYLGMGRINIEMTEYPEAESYLEKALAIAVQSTYGELARDSYEELSKLYEYRGNYQEALRLHKKLKMLEDSLFSEKKNEQFAKLQLLHETEQKDAEIRLFKQQVNNEEFKSNVLVVILALASVILFNLYRSSIRRKKINGLLLAHQSEIEAKSKEMEGLLVMKDKFFSILSHDLRSPINALVGLLDMLHDGHMSQDELKNVTVSLKSRLTKTRKLLDNLLDWALIQMDQFTTKEEKVNLYAITEDNVNFFKEINEKHVHFFNKVDEDTIILADKNMVDLVIRNIVSNSVKFTAEGGTIEISSKPGNSNKGEIIVSIADNGMGMTEEQVRTLFDSPSLYSTRGTANETGTGLGLKLCSEFVERMGGRIWVESHKDEGSVFNFTVKIAKSD
jgi:signal transduction histidine kinase/uncharacterized protein HemY